MAKPAGKTKTKGKSRTRRKQPLRLRAWLARWLGRALLAALALILGLVLLFSVINPPITHTIWSEYRRLGKVERDWVSLEQIAPVMARSVVAAEDANFCLHWGFDVNAIRAAIGEGLGRGASTLSQQVVKNVFLWQGRSWIRKALETAITPLVELTWSKRRIVEVYLNVAEMDEGVFGVAAAAEGYFGVTPDKLSAQQAARIAAVLPNPRERSASDPSPRLRKRAAAIMDGAATIAADGRADCFE
ncbi:monofunctional biosynthetic peptidoglycan transglycosylase [Ruegeria pomeroyi]|uniref:monofunctional biosynthetic peptidoglycan transglycosylase n=1 Tax=Ruegeria pomeroyi TaxID=89184 RepID=UPI001F3ED39D|nr:monofunctional biosynthetic peptidoglycan transglycosylase [Ruegeria pomeroyi]MCE8508825.1 monofunctional biosynthetic peptidoglycan transglycosylase [Ruegeria pomeroyi]